jgi:hypothetical protein
MKQNNPILILFFLVFAINGYGQISTKELPVSFSFDKDVIQLFENSGYETLPVLDMLKIEQEDKDDEQNGLPPRFGYKHKVDYNLDNSGTWISLPNGDRMWHLEIYCPAALSVNLLYNKFWLPEGAKFFIYSNDKKHSIGAFTSVNNKSTKENPHGFATGLVYGEKITLEYYLPESVKETGIISIACVVHGYRYINLYDGEDKSYNGSGSCNINVNCPQGDNWQKEKNAIAMIVVGGYRWCSGSLINTTANDARPLFLTANHCMDGHDAEGDSILTSWSFYWHYESPNCTSTYDPPYESTSGATLIANNSTSDFALLRLSENPKDDSEVTPYYLGWDRTNNPGAGGVGIHHPSGDIKKISLYDMTPQSTSYLSNTEDSNANHWRVIWSAGTTEGGSSGSPLVNDSRRVIGQLHGGYASCNALNSPDWYGEFNVSWNNSANPKRRLNNWLDPNNTGVTVLDGLCAPVNFTNQTVTTDTTVTSCGDINVQNVTVTNGAKLTFIAAGEVNIISGFEVELGSEFEIVK